MNESDIRKYANLMSELGLTGLEVTENDRVVRLERNPAPDHRSRPDRPGGGRPPVGGQRGPH